MRSCGAALSAGLLAAVFGLAACADDEPTTGRQPTGVSIAPSSPAAPPSSAPMPTASGPAGKPSAESSARSEKVTTVLGAIAVAEDTVADSTAVEVSKDDDDNVVVWEVTVRAGENGRQLRIAGADGSVLSNKSDQLDASQLGDEPTVSIREAVEIAEQRVDGGVVADAELGRESGDRGWEISVEVAGGDEWELWVDATSGKVVRAERD